MDIKNPAGVVDLECMTDEPLPWYQALIGLIVFGVVGVYAFITVLYVTPNNPLRIRFDDQLLVFEKWAYQKWSFFAPPPLYNDRLYFAFSPRVGEGKTVEVLEGIYARKQQDSPVNIRAQVVDYVISGTARQISDLIREIYRYREVNALLDADPAVLDDLAKSALEPGQVEYGASVRLLLRYAALVAADQKIEPEGLKCQIVLANKPLRPFSQRFNLDYPIEEKMVYRTAVLDVPSLAGK